MSSVAGSRLKQIILWNFYYFVVSTPFLVSPSMFIDVSPRSWRIISPKSGWNTSHLSIPTTAKYDQPQQKILCTDTTNISAQIGPLPILGQK
jgi:hypothetical protein